MEDLKLLAKIQALEIRSHNLLQQVRRSTDHKEEQLWNLDSPCRKVWTVPCWTAGLSSSPAGPMRTCAHRRSSKFCCEVESLRSTDGGCGAGWCVSEPEPSENMTRTATSRFCRTTSSTFLIHQIPAPVQQYLSPLLPGPCAQQLGPLTLL